MKFKYPNIKDISHLLDKVSGFNLLTIEEFENKAFRDYETLRPWIPEKVDSVLDIGVGLGGVDIVICQNHNVNLMNIIDGDGTEDKTVSFQDNIKAWSDRNTARELIQANIPENCDVNAYPPDPELIIYSDLIISLKSWGHHYPVGVYIELVKNSLNPGGKIVMDIRKRRGNGLKIMEENGFRFLDTVYETPKCLRMVFEKQNHGS